MHFKYKTTALILAVVFLFSFDRYLKYLAIVGVKKTLIGSFIEFDFVRNNGIAFSLPLSGWPLIAIILLIEAVLVYALFFAWKKKEVLISGAYFLIIVGAASNLYDRFHYGFVVDYINVAYFSILNIADMMIFFGVVLMVFLLNKKKPINE